MRLAAVFLVVLLAASPVSAAPEREPFEVAYLNIVDDPRHAAFTGYANITLREAADPFQGAATAMSEARIIGRALDIDLELSRREVEHARGMANAVREMHDRGVAFFIVDAPAGVISHVAESTRDLDILLFNNTAPDDSLREAGCEPHVVHTLPSRAMLADALVQFVVSKSWNEILVLHGDHADDQAKVEALRRAAKRFGAELVAVRAFHQGNDPRERDRNNIELLTKGDHDVVYVADGNAGLGRHVPYRVRLPRPVIGDAGLQASAWHWASERYGAPQLNQRFQREAGRHMNGKDWASWAAVRLVVDALRATRSTEPEKLIDFIRGDTLKLDTYKGTPGNVRNWNGQLRQPVLLHTENAVIGYAPFDGFLHPTSYLDTLGHDRAESRCP